MIGSSPPYGIMTLLPRVERNGFDGDISVHTEARHSADENMCIQRRSTHRYSALQNAACLSQDGSNDRRNAKRPGGLAWTGWPMTAMRPEDQPPRPPCTARQSMDNRGVTSSRWVGTNGLAATRSANAVNNGSSD